MFKAKRRLRFIEACYRLYEQKMYHVAFRILQDEVQAEDAVQDAFVKLMKHEVEFNDPESDECKRYIISVIKNAAIDTYRKNRRTSEILYFTDRDEDLAEVADKDPYGGTSEVEELIQELPEKYYHVFNSIAVSGYSIKETALRLGITEDNVRKRYSRARKMIRDMYERRNGNETGRYKVI